LIKEAEGLRLTAYNDSLGNPTIGYGHKLVGAEKSIKTIT
jgi:GH24 family phage-related lysozyme (muramidase)